MSGLYATAFLVGVILGLAFVELADAIRARRLRKARKASR